MLAGGITAHMHAIGMTINMSAIMPLHPKHHANVSSTQTMSQMLVLLLALLTCRAKQAMSKQRCHITFACWTAIRLWPPVSAAMLAAMKQQQHRFWTQWLFKHHLNAFKGLHKCVYKVIMCYHPAGTRSTPYALGWACSTYVPQQVPLSK